MAYSRTLEEEGGAEADLADDVIASLPLETRCPPFPLRRHAGFWLPEVMLRRGLPAVRALFKPRNDDLLLAGFPKSGTTWLKALAFATLNRRAHPPLAADHPLRRRNPHDLVRFLEFSFSLAPEGTTGSLADELEALPSPRLLATHLPYHLLAAAGIVSAAAPGARRRVVYVCRDPKDVLVSSWLFTRKAAPAVGVDARGFTLDEAFELFCEGRVQGGPQWRHVLGYWEASARRPAGEVLFLRYEEMLLRPEREVRRLAEFMGCAFSADEEEDGVARAVVELCSLGRLKSMEANRNGATIEAGIESESFFRKGVAGDWSNHMSPEMARRLDGIVEDAMRGTGFTFATSSEGDQEQPRQPTQC